MTLPLWLQYLQAFAVLLIPPVGAWIAWQQMQIVALTDDLANKLRTTESRIKELEEEASRFRDRAARAEEWMQRISREIESKFIAPEGVLSKTALGGSDQDR